MDLVRNPEIVHYCLDKITDLECDNTHRTLERMPEEALVMTHISEDLGTQSGLIMPPPQIREFLISRMRRLIDLAHDFGAYVFHHDDGGIRRILPDLIIAGIDALNPIQWRCRGMDRLGLKRDFGDKLIFHGGVDNQQTLPFGNTEDVRREVAYNLRVLGRGGGYILSPCHNIQSNTPIQNVVALFEEGYRYGMSTS